MAKKPTKENKGTPDSSEKTVGSGESTLPDMARIDAIPPEVHSTKSPPPAVAEPEKAEDAVDQEPDTPQSGMLNDTAPQTPPSVAAPKTNGFLPMVLGGLIAGVIGFAVASLTAPATGNDLSDELAGQAARMSALEQRIAQIGDAAPDDATAALSTQIAQIETALFDITERLTTLENQPTVRPGTDAAVDTEIADLRAQIAALSDAAQTELDTARAAAAAIAENAAEAARNAAARAALARVQTGLESGAPIGAALSDLEQAIAGPAPDALIAVQEGVPTLASLQEQFPEAARAALATARREGVSGEDNSGLGAFLRSQFDVRATTPRDGDTTDAILSRAEAAVRNGRLSDALAEIDALPEVARADMSDWLAQAEARADAIAAVDMLSSSLSDN